MLKQIVLTALLLTLGTGCLETKDKGEPFIELEPSADYYVNPDEEAEPELNPPLDEQSNEPEAPTTMDPDAPICVNTCGNGSCEEIVCLGTGCPCAETPESCPADCR